MDMPNPSSAWTPEERLQVIAFLAVGLYGYSVKQSGLVHSAVVAAVMQRIGFVTTHTAGFLEGNREGVLESVEESVRIWVKS